jgi:hypothetical protein
MTEVEYVHGVTRHVNRTTECVHGPVAEYVQGVAE